MAVTVKVSRRAMNNPHALKIGLGFAVGLLYLSAANALELRAYPFLSGNEVFSDNLNLATTGQKQSGFVSEIDPGLSLYSNSRWGTSNLNYRLQGLYNAGADNMVNVYHQLQMNSLYQPVPSRFYIQTSSSITQQNINSSQIATDNLSGNGGRSNAESFNFSPYWTPRFGQWATGLFKAGYTRSAFDSANNGSSSTAAATVTPISSLISNSNTYSWQTGLSSGPKFNVLKWNLNASDQEQNNANGNNVRFEQFSGDARYYLNRRFNIFSNVGYENNQYQTNNNGVKNGAYYEVGGQWSPSLWYSFELGVGNNQHFTFQMNPSNRLSSHVTLRNKSVGLNNGTSWNGGLTYQYARGNVQMNYVQETTTIQQLYSQVGVFSQNPNGTLTQVVDAAGNLVNGSLLNQSNLIFNPTGFTNSVTVRKRGDIGFTYQMGKSSYTATIYNERRTYSSVAGEDTVYGASGSWSWQFQPRYNLYFQPLWQTTSGNSSTSRYDVALGVTHSIPVTLLRPSTLNAGLELRHIDQRSNTFGEYQENRATASFSIRF
jgi:uncharacterized protein (PEP-CTERM system associated)